uniref:Uncharacterized protein n=1 Tax=Avena sativa TaxID=4498 RepID=A0ACD6AGH3_AVESA
MEAGGVAVALVCVATAAWFLHMVFKWNRTSGAMQFPGSRGLPIIGESFEFFKSTPSLELIPFLKRRFDRYGPIFRTNLIGEDLIVSLDPEFNTYIFQQEEKLFHIWYPDSFMRILGEDNVINVLQSLHKHIKVLVLRLFGPRNLSRVLLGDIQRTAEASLRSWLQQPSIELKDATSSMVFSITAKRLIGYDSATADDNLLEHFTAFSHGLIAFPIYFPGTAFYKCMQSRKHIMKTLRKLFDERKKAVDVEREYVDFIDILIDDIKEGRPEMSEKIGLDLIVLLLFASSETTSSAMTIILRFLTDNPKALQELTEEHEGIRQRRATPDSEITWEEYKSMKFTSHVIHEALRLASIAPVMFRRAIEDVQIKGYTIPKGSKIMISPAATHLNPKIYEDPHVFNPWRWQNSAEPVGSASKDFMAFGGGVRLCVGADLSKLQMSIFLHCLVTKYRWKTIKGGSMVLSPGLRFPDGFHIQLLQKA